MKPTLFVAACFLILTGSLRADQAPAPKEQLTQSRATWEKLKADCAGNYSYKVSFTSWVGFGHETIIVVRNNKVAERTYREFSNRPPQPIAPGPQPPPAGETWTERDAAVGKHPTGAPAKTLDELYTAAAAVVDLKLQPHEKLYLGFDKRGLLNNCFVINTMIADDAPKNGVSIRDITLGLPAATAPGS